MPRVSIILPTYNRARALPLAIGSVLTQTYTDFELIIVDDGSSDDTNKLFDTFTDKRIRIIRHTHNQGVAAARNTGIENAHCDIIAFQDSDDEWLPTKLEKHMRILETASPAIGVTYSAFQRERDGATTIVPDARILMTNGAVQKQLLERNWITLQACVIRMSCFKTVGLFDTSLCILDDWEWLVRAAEHFTFLYIPEPLVYTHETTGNLTSQKNIRMEDRKKLIKKHYRAYQNHPRALTNISRMIAGAEYKKGKIQEARSYYLQALYATPFDLRSIGGLLRTFLSRKPQ